MGERKWTYSWLIESSSSIQSPAYITQGSVYKHILCLLQRTGNKEPFLMFGFMLLFYAVTKTCRKRLLLMLLAGNSFFSFFVSKHRIKHRNFGELLRLLQYEKLIILFRFHEIIFVDEFVVFTNSMVTYSSAI